MTPCINVTETKRTSSTGIFHETHDHRAFALRGAGRAFQRSWRTWTESWRSAAPLLVLAALLLAACSDTGPAKTGNVCPGREGTATTGGELTLERLADRVSEASTCPGYVLHLHTAGESGAGPFRSAGETDLWVDLDNNQGRREWVSRLTSEEAAEEYGVPVSELPEGRGSAIVRADGRYSSEGQGSSGSKMEPPDCHGAGREALSLVINCDGPLEEYDRTIDPDPSYRGHAAVALVAEGTSSGEDETYHLTNRLYFDAVTFLPLGSTSEGTLDYGEIFPVEDDLPYDSEFVPLASLPQDFFDPASIGYVAEDPEEPLDAVDAGVTIYWLGTEFESQAGFPALALDEASVAPLAPSEKPSEKPSFDYHSRITYRRTDNEFGPPMVGLQLYDREAWDAFLAQSDGLNSWDGPCVEKRELELADRRIIIYSGQGAPNQEGECPPAATFLAHVYFDDAVVFINTLDASSGNEFFESDYDSAEAMELLARGLKARR